MYICKQVSSSSVEMMLIEHDVMSRIEILFSCCCYWKRDDITLVYVSLNVKSLNVEPDLCNFVGMLIKFHTETFIIYEVK